MLPGVVGVFHILLYGAKGSYTHRDCCCFEPPNSLNLYFQVFLFVASSFSVVLTEVLVSRDIVMSMGRQVLSFLFFGTTFCLSAAMVLSVWMGISLRMMTLSLSVTVLGSFSYHLPSPQCQTLCRPSSACVQLPCCSGDIFSFSQFSAARDQMVNGLVETATPSTFWVLVRLLEYVVLLPACWEALILGCDDKVLGFCLEASCF